MVALSAKNSKDARWGAISPEFSLPAPLPKAHHLLRCYSPGGFPLLAFGRAAFPVGQAIQKGGYLFVGFLNEVICRRTMRDSRLSQSPVEGVQQLINQQHLDTRLPCSGICFRKGSH